jgi:ABC-type transport system substrate-binding protein
MRRPLAATAALATLFLAAACSDGPASSTAAAPPAAATPTSAASAASGGATEPAAVDPVVAASADAALAGNTKAICAQAGRTSATFGDAFIADLKLQIDSAGKGADAVAQARQKVQRDVLNYSYALSDMAKLSADPALKRTLTAMSRQVTSFAGDVKKINATGMSQLTTTLDKACGKG